MAIPTGSTVTVRLLQLPVPVQVAASAHMEALQREFDVMEVEHGEVPQQLRALIDELGERYGGVGTGPQEELAAAIEQGREAVDLEYQVPPDVAAASARLSEVLDQVDEYCREGEHLLTLATSDDLLRYRRWFLGQFISQIGGAAPVPWPEFTGSGPLTLPPDAEPPEVPLPTADGSAQNELPSGWHVEDTGDSVTVRPAGEIDLQTAPQVRDVVQSARREHAGRVELDLSAVTFIDSVGLSMIVSAHQRLEADGVSFAVVVPSRLRRLFEISGLDQLIDLRV